MSNQRGMTGSSNSNARNGPTQSGSSVSGNAAPGTTQSTGFIPGLIMQIPAWLTITSQPPPPSARSSSLLQGSGQAAPVNISINMSATPPMPIPPSRASIGPSQPQGTDTRPENTEERCSGAAAANSARPTTPTKSALRPAEGTSSPSKSPGAKSVRFATPTTSGSRPAEEQQKGKTSRLSRPLNINHIQLLALQCDLRQLSGGELREIVLSMCLEHEQVRNGVIDATKKMEAKNDFIPTGGIGIHLQYLSTIELENLILLACEGKRDWSFIVRECVLALIRRMLDRKEVGRTLS